MRAYFFNLILQAAFIIELNLYSRKNKVYIIEKFNTDTVLYLNKKIKNETDNTIYRSIKIT